MNINEKARLRQWAQDMTDQKASGMTVANWCEANNIKRSTYEKSRFFTDFSGLINQQSKKHLITAHITCD